jgi:ABC-type sugar transport system substrate-binding protein
MRRRLTLLAATAAAAVTGIGLATPALASPAAPAGTTIAVSYPVNGSTFINAVGASISLGPGTLAAKANLNTGALSAKLTLPPATGSFDELGVVPVTATTQLTQIGAATGKINLTSGAVTTTARVTIQLTSLNVAGIPVFIGPRCETSPATITVASQPGFNVVNGGTLSGTYTIPPFANCALATLLINLTLPGPGNTISLTLGKGTIGG